MPGEFVAASDRLIFDIGGYFRVGRLYPKRLYAAQRMNRRSVVQNQLWTVHAFWASGMMVRMGLARRIAVELDIILRVSVASISGDRNDQTGRLPPQFDGPAA